jgi:hypothetical protein
MTASARLLHLLPENDQVLNELIEDCANRIEKTM